MVVLLSWHGTILCRDPRGNGFVHRPIDAAGDVEPITIDLAWDKIRADFDRAARSSDDAVHGAINQGPLEDFILTIDGRRRWVSLARRGRFLSAQRDGRVAADRPAAREWERFLPLTAQDLDQLRFTLRQAWVLRSTLRVVRAGEVRLTDGFRIAFGDREFDLPYQLPFDLDPSRFRLTLLGGGWRIEQACLFNPLIYTAGMRKPKSLHQLWLSLRSLTEIAHYRGQVHVLTDRTPAEVLEQVPLLDPARLSVQRMPPTDRVGAIASKYAIIDWAEAAAFQPLFYADADIIYDTDLSPMLATICASDRIVAPIEEFSPMRRAASAGAKLLAEDGVNPQGASGFNAGTLGIPNLRDHGHTLRLMRRIIVNRSDLLGRKHFSWVDQPIANYVSHRLAHVDTHLLHRFVRYGYPGVENDIEGRAGLVHFWPPMDDDRKITAMTVYLERLRAARAAATTGQEQPVPAA